MKTENTIREEALGGNDVCREGKGGIQLAVSSQQVQVPVEGKQNQVPVVSFRSHLRYWSK